MNQRDVLSVFAIAGALLILVFCAADSYAQEMKAGSGQQHQRRASNLTKELITFKGIPFGKPAIKNALKTLCAGNDHNKGYGNRCSLETSSFNNATGFMFFVEYGPLEFNYGSFMLDHNEALSKLEINNVDTQELLELVANLTEKYGKPSKATSILVNGFGNKLEKNIYSWRDSEGTRISVESIYEKVGEGRVVIETASSIAAQDTAEKMEREAVKSNL